MKNIVSKILVSTIFVLSSLIYSNTNEENKNRLKNELFEENLSFYKLNNYYKKFINKAKEKEEILVSDQTFDYTDLIKEEDHYIYKTPKGRDISFINGGIIVYIGDKDLFKDCIIVQGNDGVDILYSNISIEIHKVYDYVSKNEIIGNSNADKIYIKFSKNSKPITYEEYIG